MISLKDLRQQLELDVLVESTKTEIDVSVTDVNRPGMQLVGFYEYFAYERPQVIGKVEMTYLESLEPSTRYQFLDKYMSYPIPCIIIGWSMKPPRELLDIARERDIPVFSSSLKTTRLVVKLISYLSRVLAPHVTRHGVLVDVYGVGVLLTGDSGVGKSEAALELVKRGHQLCADDVVDICRVSADKLVGESPERVRHFMEIRGIGIIDIRAMYGIGAVSVSTNIDLVIHMEKWDSAKEYDRLGLTDDSIDILDVKVPYQVMPVKPGRNVAIIIEVAARNLSLKRMGYNAAHELDRRLTEMLMQNS